MVRAALISVIEEEADLSVVAECGRGDEAIDLARANRPDIALLDIAMPGADGIEVCSVLHEIDPSCRCILLTALDRPGLLQRAMAAGARGYVVKYAPVEDMIRAVRDVAKGGRVVDPALAAAALEQPVPLLSQRETEIVELGSEGLSDREIAKHLNLSQGTIRNYFSNMMLRTGSRNRIDLLRIAEARGWFLRRRHRDQ